MKEHIRVIEGKWEGIYSWIAVNYILDKLKASNSSQSSRPDTVGMIDMGGASMQIAFEMEPKDEFRSENVENVNLGCRDDDDRYKYKLFVTTFLGYGVNEGLRKYEQELSDRLLHTKESYVRDECMPVNLQKVINRSDGTMFVRKGIGDWDGCVKQLAELLNKPSIHPKYLCQPKCFFGTVAAPLVSLSKMKLYGFSEYWYSLDEVLSLGGQYNHSLIAEKSKQYCSQRWSQIQAAARRKLYPKSNEDRLKSQCFKSAWITAILHDGFEVDRQHNKFQSAFTIAGQEVQWALGAMIYHMRYFPLKNSATNLVVNKNFFRYIWLSLTFIWLISLKHRMTIYLVMDGHQPNIFAKPEESDEKEKRNSIYLQILKELLGIIANRQPELEIEVIDQSVDYSKNKGNLHLGRLFDKIRPNMSRDDAVVLLTDASVFKVPQFLILTLVLQLLRFRLTSPPTHVE
ncbi:GDA1/CD39 family protein [Ancylostoma duodenale]|uniref:GDA1/CD39 family protein n=1 Tax=Ancylostoma duodenale TaxID=51022 RepID=A0A0C2BTQ7_9BILA|nr:GDA1/CD39 family protein [Ancylostoma duodenale]